MTYHPTGDLSWHSLHLPNRALKSSFQPVACPLHLGFVHLIYFICLVRHLSPIAHATGWHLFFAFIFALKLLVACGL